MYKVDLHTHSEASRDGGITADQYANILGNEIVDIIAITDHDRIDFALGMQKALGANKVIVGEEITTTQGEIIGLFLSELVKPGMTVKETIAAIKMQNGIVYIPHPFEKVRSGIEKEVLLALIDDVDIIEGFNGRAFVQNFGPEAVKIAKLHAVTVAASSDAHGFAGVGSTYTTLQKLPTRQNIISLMAHGRMVMNRPPFYTLFYPKINRLKKLLMGQR
jgi:predicted metal-dependent phosphoesterase TrpH